MIAAGFLAQGAAKVYITARKAGPCEATAKELSGAYDGQCIALPIDISTMAGIDMLAGRNQARAEARYPSTMPARHGAPISTISRSGWDKVMNLNLKTPFFLTRRWPRRFEPRRPRTSPAGRQHRLDRRHLRQPDGDLFYAASKSGLIHLTRRMAVGS
jgi:NAD(P)-dependent dehydrogenase (short-subunit alcohol dehydrogenase family)